MSYIVHRVVDPHDIVLVYVITLQMDGIVFSVIMIGFSMKPRQGGAA